MARIDTSFKSTRPNFQLGLDEKFYSRRHNEHFVYPDMRLPDPSVQYTKINTSNSTSGFAITNPAFYRKSNVKVLKPEMDKDLFDNMPYPKMTKEQIFENVANVPVGRSSANLRHPDDVSIGLGNMMKRQEYITGAQWAKNRMPMIQPSGTISY